MGDMESRSLQALLTAGESPKEEPMNRFTAEYPSTPADASFSENKVTLKVIQDNLFNGDYETITLERVS